MKIKCKNNPNIASPSSVSPKNSTPVNLQNRFDNLMVTEVNQIETHESQDHAPTNHHKRCKIRNSRSKSRAEKNNSHIIRPSEAITLNKINTQSKNLIRAVPGNRSYASTMKYRKKDMYLTIQLIKRNHI